LGRKFFEVATHVTDKKVVLVIDPYAQKPSALNYAGDDLGGVVPLDKLSNLHDDVNDRMMLFINQVIIMHFPKIKRIKKNKKSRSRKSGRACL